MREIKFRAWQVPAPDGSEPGYMTPWTDLYADTELNRILGGDFPGVIPMQFIGVKDQDGVEIYEGDILRVAGTQRYEVRFIFELQYGEKTCGFGLKNPSIDHAWIIDEWAIQNGVVIGNIHENPELLALKEAA